MPPKKDLCRNFQRGSCQYGDRCKFLHATPQQPKTNPFGFGAQSGSLFKQANQQQQMPNPFGFGVQNNNQSRWNNDFGSKPNHIKPYENKSTPFSPLNNCSSAPTSRQPENQQQAANHKCTDSESCKRIIVEDLENEKPLWKLTCYAHSRNGPCDVVGDISCEELRALAYDDAKQGRSLQFIIDRERNLLNSKLAEFQNLVQKPYVVSSVATPSIQNSFAGVGANAPVMNSGFSSPAPVMNSGFSSPAPVMNSGFSPPASSFSQSPSPGSTALPSYTFGQSSTNQNNTSQPSNMFRMNSSPFNNSGTFGSKPMPSFVQSSFAFGSANLSNSANNAQSNAFATLASSPQTGKAFGEQSNFASGGLSSTSSAFGQSSISLQLTDSTPKEKSNVDDSIWKKAEWKWNVGEIPEDAPPDIYIH